MASSPTPPTTGSGRAHLLAPGTDVRGYTILETAGYGGMGAVYRATFSAEFGHEYALKVAFENPEADEVTREEQRARIRREFSSVHQLQHPNLLTPTEFFLWPDPHSGTPVIVMPFIRGRTLGAHIREVRPTLRTILCRLLGPVAEGVGYLHAKGIIHRDIKSSNIFVREADGVPLLMDFGIVRADAGATLTRVSGLFGTPEVTSPENIRHVFSADGVDAPFVPTPQSDLFCLGAAFFSVLTGQLPFAHLAGYTAGSSSFVLNAKFHRALEQYEPVPPSALNPQLPPELDTLFLRLMARDPEQRFPSTLELHAELARIALTPAPHPVLDVPFEAPAKPPRPPTVPPPTSPQRPSAMQAASQPSVPPPTSPSLLAPSLAPPAAAPAAPSLGAALGAPSVAAGAASLSPSAAPAPSVVPGAVDVLEFRPPTVAKGPASFVDPAVHRPPPPQPSLQGQMPTAVRELRRQLEAAGPAGRQRTALYLGVGLGLVALLVVASAVAFAPAAPAPARSILDDVAARPPSSPSASTLASALPPPPSAPLPVAAPPVSAPDAGADALEESPPVGPVAAAPVRRRPATEDARAVDEVLRQQYGGQRPVLPSSAAAETPTPPVEASISTRPAWLKGGGKRTQAQPLKRTYGVPTGAELSVQLLRPLDSRLTSSGPVAAKLRRSLVVGGALVLPASTLLYGTAAANQAGRFDIRFSRLRLPDNTEVSFEGLAYDAADKKPGLHATHRILPDAAPSTGPSVGEAVLKSVASATLSQVPADAVADVAKTGAQAAISRAGEGSPSGAAAMPAILLDAPHDFVVFVTAPF